MQIITIDGKDYDTERMSAEAKAQLASIQFVDGELARLQAHAANLKRPVSPTATYSRSIWIY